MKTNIPNKDYFEIYATTKNIPSINLGYILSEYEEYKKFNNIFSNLSVPLGIDTRKNCWLSNLITNSPILITGNAGKHKYSFFNSILISLIYQNDSESLKFIIFNLKNNDLNIYNQTKYMFSNVVSQDTDLISTLDKINNEIKLRSELFKKQNVKNINQYNKLTDIKKLPFICVLISDLEGIFYRIKSFEKKYFLNLLSRCKFCGVYLIYQLDIPISQILKTYALGFTNDFVMFKLSTSRDSDFVCKVSSANELVYDDIISYSAHLYTYSIRLKIPYITKKEVKDFIQLLQ